MRRRRWLSTGLVAGLLVVGCGDSDEGTTADDASGTEATAATVSPAETTPTSDIGDGAGMSIETICDPIEPVAIGWLGDRASPRHHDMFADDPDVPMLVCEWSTDDEYREVRVVVHGSLDVWGATIATEGVALPGVAGESHLHDGTLSAQAANGWTIDVNLYASDPPERVIDEGVQADLANAVLDAVG